MRAWLALLIGITTAAGSTNDRISSPPEFKIRTSESLDDLKGRISNTGKKFAMAACRIFGSALRAVIIAI